MKAYDICFLTYESNRSRLLSTWPTSKCYVVDNKQSLGSLIQQIQQESTTDMFWLVDIDYDINDDFNFDYVLPKFFEKFVHVFKESKTNLYHGVFLIPKNYKIDEDESQYLFFKMLNQVNIPASTLKSNDIFITAYNYNYEDVCQQYPNAYVYLIDDKFSVKDALYDAFKRSLTTMFYFVNLNYNISKSFIFDFYLPKWDQKYIHVFKEMKSNQFCGVFLISKQYNVQDYEAKNLIFTNKKEIDIVASSFKPMHAFIGYYNNEPDLTQLKKNYKFVTPVKINVTDSIMKIIQQLQQVSTTEMFCFVEPDHEVLCLDLFDYCIPEWDTVYVHVCKEQKTMEYSGVYFIPKSYNFTTDEINQYMFINKKHVDIVASVNNPKYDIVYANDYDDFCEKHNQVSTQMFYLIPSHVLVDSSFKFDYSVPKDNRNKIHVFKNCQYYDGISLIPRDVRVSKKEFEYNFFIKKIEVDINLSNPKQFDIVFISYNESNADVNYHNLCLKFPSAKRVHGIKGIHNAHKYAASLVQTSMFWVVDGDAEILDNFNFDYQVPSWNFDSVYVCRSQNPINDLIYGYGGVKLLPTALTMNLNAHTVDMTTSISKKFNVIPVVSNVSKFNTDPFNTWRSAFRECAKLSSKIINNQKDIETQQRLDIWCSIGNDREYGKYALAGANSGKEFGFKNKDSLDSLAKINDWNWLRNKFDQQFNIIR